MVVATCRVGKRMRETVLGGDSCGVHGHFAAGQPLLFGAEVADAKAMTSRSHCSQLCRNRRFRFKSSAFWKFILPVGFLVVLFLGARANAKGFQRNLEDFFGAIDQDGNGEIEQGEATKFLRKLDAQITDDGEMETKEGMSELIALSQFDFNFSYGGNTISAEEMLDHLSNMMTANHVVDWVTHGLQLPQYAEAFRQNAINGMDFPALIEHDSEALREDVGIKSTLHRTKITHALVRQIFGIGTIPGEVRSLKCYPSSYGGIQLSWEAPSNRGVPPLHKYLIERWSKTFSTWTNVADTREVIFLDKNAVKLGKVYTYRVQTWGGHGPSDWVTVGGCRADLAPPSSSGLDIDDSLPEQMVGEISNTDSLTRRELKSPSKEEVRDKWTWVNSGIILVLALISRHTFFFDVTLAAWVLLKNRLKQELRQGLVSPHFFARALARFVALACESWCYMRHKVWTLARFGVDPKLAAKKATLKSYSEPCMESPFDAEGEIDGVYLETQNFRSLSADNISERSGMELQIGSGDSRGSSPNSSVREIELKDETDNSPLFPPSSPPQDVELPTVPSKRSRSRCNHEGCKVRFDRWHSLQDWWMKLNKHYCRECQSVYCVKHTRISPHGPRGQCGLDSSCYCYSCFECLPSESKRKLEELNKLRVGHSVTSDVSSSSTSSCSLASSKQGFGSLSNSSITSGVPPPSCSDTAESYIDGSDVLDVGDAVEAKFVGLSEAASH